MDTGTLDEMTRREEIQTMNMFPTIETKRLKLRELRLVDALDLFHYSSNDEVTGYYDLDSFTELSQAENLITNWQERFNNEQGIRFGITFFRKHFKAEIDMNYHLNIGAKELGEKC